MGHEHKLGSLTIREAKRDAVHVAIAPAWSRHRLYPGQQVAVRNDSADRTEVEPAEALMADGVVDPFLPRPVEPEQWFYLCLSPGSVTDMRHEWTCPQFEPLMPPVAPVAPATAGDADLQESVEWMKGFAERAYHSYDFVVNEGKIAVMNVEPFVEQGRESLRDAYCEAPDAFWKHFTRITGLQRPDDEYFAPFSCSC